MIGQSIGPYRVLAKIGEGGMGEVYRARDTRLDRDVAIKVLPEALLGDPDRLARFEREARVLATLKHPCIAQIYGFERTGHTDAIVMELVEGPTLEACIERGPIAAPAAIRIAKQIAEALESAHDLGIIHRDLKPSNIKLTPRDLRPSGAVVRADQRVSPADLEDCAVKVLDFGLAKAVDSPVGADPLSSPTVTARATEIGRILGTAAYMAPEQARGRAVDRRADIWAFGVVLYEMLTGTRLFKGEDVSDTMAAVLRQPVTFASLPHDTPAAVRALLERCLERDARQRLRDIGEARIMLDPGSATTVVAGTAADLRDRGPRPSSVRIILPWVLFAMTAVLAAALAFRHFSTPSVPTAVTRFKVGIGVPGSLAVDTGPAAVLSPDGRTIVLRVRHEGAVRLYARRLDELAPVALAGSEQAANPFFSPDGNRIGFFASGALKIMPLAGGAVTTLTDATTGRGAAWDDNGEILYQPSILQMTPLVRINASGARIESGTTLAPGETTHRWPQFLPGGRVLYSGHSDVSNWDTGTLRVETTPGQPGKLVLRGGFHGRYVPTGHLLYVHAGTLFGVGFDLESLEVTSSPVPVIEHLAATPVSGSAQYSFASDGTLAYVQGGTSSGDAQIHWITPRGETSALKTTPGTWGNPRFSPDGKRIALQVAFGSHDQISVYDLASDRLTQLTFDPANHRAPTWMPDGQRIIYSSDASGGDSQNLYWIRADGSGAAEQLTKGPGRQIPDTVHPSGRFIVYADMQGAAPAILWILPLDGSPEKGWTPGTPRAFTKGASFDALAAISPDGRLVAYMSNAEGPFDIYVRPFEGAGGPWRVSTGGGAHAVWSRTTNELVFTTEDQLLAARYRYDGKAFTSEVPKPWAPIRYASGGPIRKFDLHPDGQRAVVASPDTTGAASYDTVVFVLNFFGELQRLLPAAR